jgi:hypothetical protein
MVLCARAGVSRRDEARDRAIDRARDRPRVGGHGVEIDTGSGSLNA